MNYSQNPFQELYVADTVSQEHFVQGLRNFREGMSGS